MTPSIGHLNHSPGAYTEGGCSGNGAVISVLQGCSFWRWDWRAYTVWSHSHSCCHLSYWQHTQWMQNAFHSSHALDKVHSQQGIRCCRWCESDCLWSNRKDVFSLSHSRDPSKDHPVRQETWRPCQHRGGITDPSNCGYRRACCRTILGRTFRKMISKFCSRRVAIDAMWGRHPMMDRQCIMQRQDTQEYAVLCAVVKSIGEVYFIVRQLVTEQLSLSWDIPNIHFAYWAGRQELWYEQPTLYISSRHPGLANIAAWICSFAVVVHEGCTCCLNGLKIRSAIASLTGIINVMNEVKPYAAEDYSQWWLLHQSSPIGKNTAPTPKTANECGLRRTENVNASSTQHIIQ